MITGHQKGKIAALLISDQHSYLADLKEDAGGLDEGMDPHRLLEASLTACTIMTVHIYAKLKKIPLNDTQVIVKIESEGVETRITRKIHFTGEALTDEQKSKLLEIANKCPIHRLLTGHNSIETSAG